VNKRIVFLILILILALAACGGQEEATPQAEAPTEEMAAATEAPPTAETMPAEAPTAAPADETAVTEPTEAPAAAGMTVAEMEHVADPGLVNITWQWISRDPNGTDVPEIMVANPENYTLYFNEDGTFNATLDCNTGSGVYATPSYGTILLELGATTRAACPEDSHDVAMMTIFGGGVQTYELRDENQTLVLYGANNGPMDIYRSADALEPGQAEVESIPADAIQLDLNGLATSYDWTVMAASPLSQGPGAQGFPPYILLTFDGATPDEAIADNLQRIYIFPTEAYVNLYQAAGNQSVADQVIRLGQLISTAAERSTLPDSPMPLLPPPNSLMDRWAQFADLNFGVGDGVRYVSDSPSRQSIGVWTNETTGYYYQGLSTDQTFYVSMYWPVSTAALPDTEADATEAQTSAATNPDTYPAYKQETVDTLNALTPADWSPDLSLLDAMAASLTFPLPQETVEEQATAEPEATPEGEAEATATPTPAAPTGDGPSGTITAPDGVFVRSGPGTEFPDIDVAANGSTVNIVGKSEDSQWWAISVPAFLAEDEVGWVSSAWVDAVNVADVPVMEASEVQPLEPSLTGVNWQWVSMTDPATGTTTINDPTRYTILFNSDGTAAIKADCNQVGASYTADGSSISITLGPSTLAACADDSRDQQYLAALGSAAVFFFDGGDLFIDLAADGGTIQFSTGAAPVAPAPTATPEGTPAATPEATPDASSPVSPVLGLTFNLVSYGPQGAEQSLIEGTSITAVFNPGTVAGNAGCNDYTGQVTPVEDFFTISSIAVTQQACEEPAGVMEQEQAYLAALQGTSGYQWVQGEAGGGVITGGRLLYTLADGTSGVLNFVAQ
jgi:heat shock protein HslJ